MKAAELKKLIQKELQATRKKNPRKLTQAEKDARAYQRKFGPKKPRVKRVKPRAVEMVYTVHWATQPAHIHNGAFTKLEHAKETATFLANKYKKAVKISHVPKSIIWHG